MVFFWTIFCALNVYGWIIVYSLYLELSDLTKLEDLAHLRVSFLFFIILHFAIYMNTSMLILKIIFIGILVFGNLKLDKLYMSWVY